MARRNRDYRAEYRKYQPRREALARSRGYKNESQQRRARKAYKTDPNLRRDWQRKTAGTDMPVVPPFGSTDEGSFADFYDAFYDPKESKRRDRNSARAHWFVDVVGKVQSYDDWEERYGR